jgi:arylsulfatase A-like enzyme
MSARPGALLPLLLLCTCTLQPERAHPKTPNILLIVADDHAAHAMSCYGSQLDRTPNLDRLAAQGARFANAFVTNALCGPSRACILTGKYGPTTASSATGRSSTRASGPSCANCRVPATARR